MNYVINIDLKPRLSDYNYDCIYCILSTHFYVHVSIISIISSLLKKYFKTASVVLVIWFGNGANTAAVFHRFSFSKL